MLDVMKAKEEISRSTKKEDWLLYILECSDGSFYTGVTKNLVRRIKAHTDGRASRFTRTRRPVKLRYQELCSSRTQALVREYAVKSLSRNEKETLIKLQASAVTCKDNS